MDSLTKKFNVKFYIIMSGFLIALSNHMVNQCITPTKFIMGYETNLRFQDLSLLFFSQCM